MARNVQSRRNQLARERGFASYAQQRKYAREIANRSDFARLPPAAQQSRQAALDAVSTARREGVDLASAARRAGTTPQAVAWWAGDAVARAGRSYRVVPADRLYRPMYVYSGGQPVTIDVRGSRKASAVGAYHAAIQHYLNTGDASRLSKFSGVTIGGVELETDLDVIDELARRGSFEFESIYRMVS